MDTIGFDTESFRLHAVQAQARSSRRGFVRRDEHALKGWHFGEPAFASPKKAETGVRLARAFIRFNGIGTRLQVP
jgi:hypothetical protein